MRKGMVEALAYMGKDASLLAQLLDGRLALADSLKTTVKIGLVIIPSTDKALSNLGTFAFVSDQLIVHGWQAYVRSCGSQERGEAQVRVVITQGPKVQDVAWGLWCYMMRTFLSSPLSIEKTCALYWFGRSCPHLRSTIFERTGTCADCSGRTARENLACPHLLRHGGHSG